MNFTIVGAGYVGLSLSVLLSQNHRVVLLDIDKKKVEKINNRKSPIKDEDIEEFFKNKKLSLFATSNNKKAYEDADYVIVATPTNYDSDEGNFDTSSVESVIKEALKYRPEAYIVMKSTIPLGFTDNMRIRFKTNRIIFAPEFLRESKALYDNLYPSRIVVGDNTEDANLFAEALLDCSKKNKDNTKIFLMKSKEAEAVKLFANTYLAMRISFFNELDSFSEVNNLSTKEVIRGICSDSRIGEYYNNPSFGYGGYCLPKDTQQLLKSYNNIPNNIIRAVVDSNKTRKEFIVSSILRKSPKTVGVYRLVMKNESDNFRESAVLDIIRDLQEKNINIILYEPLIKSSEYRHITLVNNLDLFFSQSDIIIANRESKELKPVLHKVYSRDIFNDN